MPGYIHQLPDWPRFRWDGERFALLLASVRHDQGRLLGHMEALGFHPQQDAVLRTLTDDVVKTSDIEGEKLDREQVRSSLARRLGMDIGGMKSADRYVDGVVEMMLDATQNFDEPLTAERLFRWHAGLFPEGRSGLLRIHAGRWRDDATGAMQVVSGAAGHEKVHYEAPAADRLEKEMGAFLDWFNSSSGNPDGGASRREDPLIRAGLAHFWFVTIHPLDDGNGRVARAIADMALSRSEGTSQRYYSMSSQIRRERSAYYEILEKTQQGTLEITGWMEWFLGCLGRAIASARTVLSSVLAKAQFRDAIRDVALNERQRRVLNRLLDGFEGKLTTVKWARLEQCSHDTALRDIQALVNRGILVRNSEGGRSTSYSLVEKAPNGHSVQGLR